MIPIVGRPAAGADRAARPRCSSWRGTTPSTSPSAAGRAAERQETFPYVFMKPPSTTLTRPGDPIVMPRVSPDHIDWECELGVVIGRTLPARRRGRGDGLHRRLHDRQRHQRPRVRPNPDRKPRERDKFFDWLHGKWHDTFCPMGPCILSADVVPDPQALPIQLCGQRRGEAGCVHGRDGLPGGGDRRRSSRELVTLQPGDVIATGTPSGVGSATGTYLRPGDLVVATIEPIGTLENPVEAEEDEDL